MLIGYEALATNDNKQQRLLLALNTRNEPENERERIKVVQHMI